ncbi:MAG TPA: ABC transporter permease [Kofleriaceae bacterium]|nr:ABC transporter permease [Kofleriaceae bacterium]
MSAGPFAPRRRAGQPDWLVIARREFLERIRTPWFIVVTLLGPIMMIGLMVLPVVLATSLDASARIQIVDASGKLGPAIAYELTHRSSEPWKAEVVPPDTTEATLLRRIADDEIDGFLTIPSRAPAPTAIIDYQGENATSQKAMMALYTAVTTAAQKVRGGDQGISADTLSEVLAPVAIDMRHTTGQAPGESSGGLLIVSYAVLFVLYMAIVLYATNVMRSVVQEKSNRVVEIMAAAAKPRALMLGKILGVGTVGLVQLGLWVTMAVLTMTYRGTVLGVFGLHAGSWSVPSMTAPDVTVILVYFLLGYFLYASIFAAIGAMVSNEQEAQQVQTPVMMLLVIPMVSMSVVSGHPRGGAAEAMTQIPLSSPVLMPMRWMLGGASTGSLLVSLAILVVTTALVVMLAGRIYRTGILMLGKRPSLGELWRWLRYPG